MSKISIRLLEIRDKGKTLKLADGSLLRVDPFDLPEINTWSPTSEIELAQTRDRVFNYTLTNRDTYSWVRAAKLN
jgi:hypothetical protein